MRSVTALGHQLENLHDGLTVFLDGTGRPMPLIGTRLAIEANNGLAVVSAVRVFKNEEDVPIEAVLTMPVGFEAVVTGLTAEVEGKHLKATAQPKNQARETYEDAAIEGKLSVLHEETIRGIHVLSIANLAPGREAVVTLRFVCPLSVNDGQPFLRLPVTAGQLYGASPLAPADDLISRSDIVHRGTIQFSTDVGTGQFADGTILKNGETLDVSLDHAIEITVASGVFGTRYGKDENGRSVKIQTRPAPAADRSHDLTILVDHSGSTASFVEQDKTVWDAIQDGLLLACKDLSPKDHISLWEFSSTYQHLGNATGLETTDLIRGLSHPAGGCPSSDNLEHQRFFPFGGSGSSLIEFMRFQFGGASAA